MIKQPVNSKLVFGGKANTGKTSVMYQFIVYNLHNFKDLHLTTPTLIKQKMLEHVTDLRESLSKDLSKNKLIFDPISTSAPLSFLIPNPASKLHFGENINTWSNFRVWDSVGQDKLADQLPPKLDIDDRLDTLVVLYDLTDLDSLEHAVKLSRRFFKDSPFGRVLLVGNKLDLGDKIPKRVFEKKVLPLKIQASSLLKQENDSQSYKTANVKLPLDSKLYFIKISAKPDKLLNINELFTHILQGYQEREEILKLVKDRNPKENTEESTEEENVSWFI